MHGMHMQLHDVLQQIFFSSFVLNATFLTVFFYSAREKKPELLGYHEICK